jgi:hypothetical protein
VTDDEQALIEWSWINPVPLVPGIEPVVEPIVPLDACPEDQRL